MKKLLALVAATSLLAGCGLSAPNVSTENGQKIGTKRVLPKGAKKWTIMVHLAADNNLYSFGLEDMNEMEAGINPEDVNVVVLFDGTSQGDSAVYTIQKDPAGKNSTFVTKPNYAVPFIPANHEIDSGNVEVAKAFGEWAIANYPAENYMYSQWDHGSGIFKKGTYQATEFFSKGFGWDDNGGHMNTADISYLMPAFAKAAGKPIDILGFDACLMAHLEIAYQAKGSTSYLVASEELEPGAGWDYAGWLKNVNGSMNAAQVSSALVDAYGKSYVSGGSQNPSGRQTDYTLSAVDINAMTTGLVPAMNKFAATATAALGSDKAALQAARTATQTFYNKDCADIGHFADKVQAGNASAPVKAAALDVQKALKACIIRETHTGKSNMASMANAQGLVVYFPNVGMSYNSSYDNAKTIAYAAEGWKDFVKAFVKK